MNAAQTVEMMERMWRPVLPKPVIHKVQNMRDTWICHERGETWGGYASNMIDAFDAWRTKQLELIRRGLRG